MIIEGESLYDFYKRNKICVYCGQENAAPNRVSCINCLEKQREAQRRLREKETPEKREKRLEYSREYNRKKREERKNTGKCIHCDKKVIKPGTSFCLEHYIKNKKNNDKRKQPIERNERKSYGKCYVCNEPIGAKCNSMCDKCYAMVCANLPQNMHRSLYMMRKQQNKAIFKN